MKTYSKPSDTPNKCLRRILECIEVNPEFKYLEIARETANNKYCLRNKYVGDNVSGYMNPERLMIWFGAYVEGTKHAERYNENKEYETKLINKEI